MLAVSSASAPEILWRADLVSRDAMVHVSLRDTDLAMHSPRAFLIGRRAHEAKAAPAHLNVLRLHRRHRQLPPPSAARPCACTLARGVIW